MLSIRDRAMPDTEDKGQLVYSYWDLMPDKPEGTCSDEETEDDLEQKEWIDDHHI